MDSQCWWESNSLWRHRESINSGWVRVRGRLQAITTDTRRHSWRKHELRFIKVGPNDLFTSVARSACQFMRKIMIQRFFILSSSLLSDSGDSEDKSGVDNKKRRRNKVHEIKEESQITSDFAQHLDLLCMSKGLVKAPSIGHGYIAKYNRWEFDGICFWFRFFVRTKAIRGELGGEQVVKDYLNRIKRNYA